MACAARRCPDDTPGLAARHRLLPADRHLRWCGAGD
nr:hypothetical protein [Tanacetum cinerariifolium]